MIVNVASRDEFPRMLNEMGLVGEGVEVGVLMGEFSSTLLSTWKCKKLHLVDRWTAYSAKEFTGTSPVQFGNDVFEKFYQDTVHRMEPFGERASILRMDSVEAAGRFESRSLDFVYIDANHAYPFVKRDLEAWYPKVKVGGIFAGHDYMDGQGHTDNFGVKTAVDEFMSSRMLKLFLTEDNPASWFCMGA